MVLSKDIESFLPLVTLHRRALHRIPEIAHCEFLTQEYITGELDKLKLKYKRHGTGVVCDLAGANKKIRVGLRADMDGLAVRELNGVEYKSAREGFMHACGHDGHMAMLLAAAAYFKENKPDFNLRLIFQPAEEGGGGAEKLIENGVLKGVDSIFALHLDPALETGKIAVSAGVIMAGEAAFDIEFAGVSAHCAQREKGADAVLAVALFITRAREMMKRYDNNNLFHVGRASGGGMRNVIAPDMKLLCTLRFFDGAAREEIMQKLTGLLTAIKDETGADHRLTVGIAYPPLRNDARAVEYVRSRVGETAEAVPAYASEDFAEYLLRVTGCFAWLGAYPGTGGQKKLHNGNFDFDEKALLYGLEYYKRILKNEG